MGSMTKDLNSVSFMAETASATARVHWRRSSDAGLRHAADKIAEHLSGLKLDASHNGSAGRRVRMADVP